MAFTEKIFWPRLYAGAVQKTILWAASYKAMMIKKELAPECKLVHCFLYEESLMLKKIVSADLGSVCNNGRVFYWGFVFICNPGT